MDTKEKPLVSICTTFFNSGKYIHRFIDSAIAQTYKNIEIVLVDNMSTDDSAKVIMGYASRDSRIRYFKNERSLGIAESLSRTFELSKGKYVIWLGADDWIARSFIANGVKGFAEHPEVAGIVPKIIDLVELEHDIFKFHMDSTYLSGKDSGVFTREWYLTRLYRLPVTLTALALVRREDAVNFIHYFIKNYSSNSSMPEELKELYRNAFAIDVAFFLEILKKYKCFAWDNSLDYLKVTHSGNLSFGPLNWDSLLGIFKYYYYHLLSYKQLYKLNFSSFYRGAKIFVGSEMLSTAMVYFLRGRLSRNFVDIPKSKKIIFDFFKEFYFWEVVAVFVFVWLRILYRFVAFVMRLLLKNEKTDKNNTSVFTKENFLDPKGRFIA